MIILAMQVVVFPAKASTALRDINILEGEAEERGAIRSYSLKEEMDLSALEPRDQAPFTVKEEHR